MTTSSSYDVGVVGAGIVGLATAMALKKRRPEARLILLDKEPRVGWHQTGHNSGVIHSGIYYRPGSLKASLCVRGGRALLSFCRENGIPVERCGKVIVALSKEELPRLEELYRRGITNQVEGLSQIGPERLKEIEPNSRGIQALHLPSVSVVDYQQVAQAFSRTLRAQEVPIRLSTPVLRITQNSQGLLLHSASEEFQVRYLISCAGLQADRLATGTGMPLPLQIIPFRGEYYELVPEKRSLVRGLIYPVPDPRLPFLGVHLSRRIDGRVEAGPNAVLAFKREGYKKTDLNLEDLRQMVSFPGFWRMAGRYWRTGLEEMRRSFSKADFVRSIQRLVPAIQGADLKPGGSGVRAQAVNEQGDLLDDFHLVQNNRSLHLCNAPSPAATASIAIGEYVAEAAVKQFGL